MIGGVLYGLLAYYIAMIVSLSAEPAISLGVFVFIFYSGSRLLILFSGIDTPYYSRERKESPYKNTPFYQSAQWVGKCYHYHDIALFTFLTLVAIGFIICLILDGIEDRPWGQTIRNLLSRWLPLS